MSRLVGLVLLIVVAGAAPPEKLARDLQVSLRELLLGALPDPLFEDASHWGLQHKNFLGRMKNDGRWWKLKVIAKDPAKRLSVEVRNLKPAGKNRQTFSVHVHQEIGLFLERQTWLSGFRLFSGSTRARAQIYINLNCEIVTRLETPKGSILPDVVIRIRVLSSDFRYDDVVVEHTAGVGGDAAEIIGDVMLGIVRQVKPSLERRLIDRANAAIVKAGDSKDIRVGLGGVSRSDSKKKK